IFNLKNSRKSAQDVAKELSRYVADYDRLQIMGLTSLPILRAALREYLQFRGEKPAGDPIKRMERELVGCKIPGYFPTPKDVVEKMLEAADLKPGMKILEPSAGKGNIADAIRNRVPDSILQVCEINTSLRSILENKGYELVANDFLQYRPEGTEVFDRILMN